MSDHLLTGDDIPWDALSEPRTPPEHAAHNNARQRPRTDD